MRGVTKSKLHKWVASGDFPSGFSWSSSTCLTRRFALRSFVSSSQRSLQLDRQIPLLLGVPKPVLEHVVFCHQEDSSWPLQEGAVLKKVRAAPCVTNSPPAKI